VQNAFYLAVRPAGSQEFKWKILFAFELLHLDSSYCSF
jgi:hypothetical protein